MLADKSTDLYIRTPWANAEEALSQINKGKAEGSRTAIWVRSRLQAELFHLGCLVYCHPGKVIFVAILLLASFCVGLKSVVFHSKIEQLWVEEGGNVEKELRYRAAALGETGSSTHQMLIQTTKDSEPSILQPASLLKHMEVLKKAVSLTVHLFDVTWSLKDMCYSPTVPNFDTHYIDQIFESFIPCAIITPLDCFWEGSKLLGPQFPVTIPEFGDKIKWTNLHPNKLVETALKTYARDYPMVTLLHQHMKRAGISTGYQEKPCLNPLDAECPITAPNKASAQEPNVGTELTGGCYGFAANYMHWPEELIVGGVTKHNKTGHILRAKALQTVVQLMGEKEMYEYWSDTYKVHHMEWSQQKAALILSTWQRMFSQEVHRLMGKHNNSSPYNMYAFSTATLNDILGKFSKVNVVKIATGYIIMLLYAAASLLRWKDPVRSQCALGIAGIILVSMTVAAGLGFCAVLGIAFNAATTQIVPFLALGLGVDDMFLITHTYAEQETSSNTSPEEQTGLLLKKTGLSVLLTSLSNMCAMFAAALIPIPALRVFSLQSAVLVLFNLATALLVFPAIVSLDLRRRTSGRYDVVCCYLPVTVDSHLHNSKHRTPRCKLQAVNKTLPPDYLQKITVLAPQKLKETKPTTELPFKEDKKEGILQKFFNGTLSLSLIGASYTSFILKPKVKVMSLLLLFVVLMCSIWGITRVEDGLDLTDIVPQDTNEHAFLKAQGDYFGFYNMFAVTQGDFEYPTSQKLLYDYHESFMRVQNIIKNDDGGLPDFWLSLFRDWLIGLQKAFDKDWAVGSITQERWYSNASDEGILAYKLLVQTGHVDNPIDKSLVTQIKLVDSSGIINPKAFYNYLSAWVANDALAYGASQGNLRPTPKEWFHVASDYDLKIPKSSPLIYAQLPFYLHSLGNTDAITNMIAQVREICQRFEERGLPNFPTGIPFLFWEQYLNLRPTLAIALLVALGSVFIVVSVVLLNVKTAALIAGMLALAILQLLGLMGISKIKLSAIPAVLAVVSIGISMHYVIHICLSFVTSIGNRERRTKMAMEHMFSPVVHGAFTMVLALTMLAFSEFDFVVRYFFYILFTLIGVGLLNGLIFLPVILSIIGPDAEIKPLVHPNRISTPSPEPVRRPRSTSCRSGSIPPRRGTLGHCHRETSLTTITEEPSWHSTTHEIIVEPEFVVETTTCPASCGHQSGDGGFTDSPGSDQSQKNHHSEVPPPSQTHITTKVTATAKLKVEVHTPIGSMESCSKSNRRSRRPSRDSSSSSDSEVGNW